MNNSWLIALSIVSVSCADNDSKVKQVQETKQESIITEVSMQEPVQIQNDAVHAIYKQYEKLTHALVASNVAETKKAALAIEAGANQVAGQEKIAQYASTISAATNIETQRETYEKLSTAMQEQVKKAGVSSGAVYIQYCPMAMNNKGAYWMSSNKEIQNPYFGEKMKTCGEVKETLN